MSLPVWRRTAKLQQFIIDFLNTMPKNEQSAMAKKLSKGMMFGDWKLMKFLGEGGSCFVWLVSNSSAETAAIKILAKLDRKSRSKTYARFKHEVEVVQTNDDLEGVLPILDSYLPAEISDKLAWYVMPVAEPIGTHLAARRTFESSIEAILSVGKLLCELHEKGICHRDIKPANILAKDKKIYLSDFGLVDFPEKPDFTLQGERIGALSTMAPEMKFHADKADGKVADVYSLAKTLWILLTDQGHGFEGQYDPNSINGLSLLNLTEPDSASITPRPLYLRPLDDLLRMSTSDDPSQRPTMNEFTHRLNSWAEIYRDFEKRNPLQWQDFQKRLFPFSVPDRAIWEDTVKIVDVLNSVGSCNNLNHMLLPGRGGMDLLGCQIGDESGTIELIVSDKSVYILKPKRLIFENFDFDLEWNYLRLESGQLIPTGITDVYRGLEELVKIAPEKYISRSEWESSEQDVKALSFDCRYLEGNFLIVQKTSIYNRISYTYDGRHSQMKTDEFRRYIDGKVRMVKHYLQSEEVMSFAKEKDVSVNEVIFHLLDKIFRLEYLNEYGDGNGDEV